MTRSPPSSTSSPPAPSTSVNRPGRSRPRMTCNSSIAGGQRSCRPARQRRPAPAAADSSPGRRARSPRTAGRPRRGRRRRRSVPVCTGLHTATSMPACRARQASAAVATVLPTPVPVPVMTRTVNGAPRTSSRKHVRQHPAREVQLGGIQGGARGQPQPRRPGGHASAAGSSPPARRRPGRRSRRPAPPPDRRGSPTPPRTPAPRARRRPRRVRRACRSTASGRHGSAFSTRSAARAAPTAAGARPVSKMNGRAASIRCARTAAGPEHHAALAAERLGQRRRHHHVGRTRQAELVQQAAAAATHAQPVRLVDDAAARGGGGTRRATRGAGPAVPSALNTESVITTARSSSRDAQRGIDGGDVAVRRHHHPGPRQPAGVDQGGVRVGVGHQQRTRTRQPDDSAQVGGVPRGEHQARCGADELGELGLEFLVQLGVAGDQARTGGAGAPGAQRRDTAVDDVGMLGQTEVVVGRQVQLGGRRRAAAAASGAARPRAAAARPRPARPAVTSRWRPPWEFSLTSRCRATSTIAEVICAISSGGQMNGGIA